jgi:hypothetical protein
MGLGVVYNSRVKRPGKRGVRAGKAARRARAAKKFVPFALVNARSLLKRVDVITHHLITYDLDLPSLRPGSTSATVTMTC